MKCQTCGKELKKKQRLYCSRTCSNKRNIQSEVRTCVKCGKVFHVYPSQNDRYGDFCSMQCARGIKNRFKTCQNCGQEFECVSNRAAKNRKYCSMKCKTEAQNTSEIVYCDVCGKAMSRPPSRIIRSGHFYCSSECRSHGISGENNWTWKGGVGSYRGPNWWKQRALTRKRDNFICQKCGITESELGQSLDVHHVKPYRLFDNYKDANQLSNLISYCHSCHLEVERTL